LNIFSKTNAHWFMFFRIVIMFLFWLYSYVFKLVELY